MPAEVRFHVFDAAVNCGTVQAALFVQRAAGVEDDGHLGPVSIAAVNAMPPDRFIRRFTALVMLFRTDLPTWGAFGRGWSKRAAHNLLLD
jgi:lysozyme family protein